MNQNDLDAFVTRIINELKMEMEPIRQSVLNDDLDLDVYRKESGVLLGVEIACQKLIDHARKFMREALDD